MRITNFFKATMVAAVVFFSASCTKDGYIDEEQKLPSTGEEITVGVNYTVEGMKSGDGIEVLNPQTRVAPSDLELIDGTTLPIENLFVIQFAGNTPTSTMIGAPRFLDKTDLATMPLSVPLIQNSNSVYTVFVANIPEGRNYNWNMSTESTFADLSKRIKTMTKEDDAFVTVGTVKTLIVSAVVDSPVVPGTPLTPVFRRSVAKLSLNLKLDNANMEIKSVRLRNVSKTIVYADAVLDKSGISSTTVYPTDVTVMDYDIVTTGMPANGATEKYTWYVPRNQRGVVGASTAAIYKTFYAPNYATYFEVVAVMTDGSATSVYRIYPGADEVSDFNLTANKHYTVGLTVKGIGDSQMDSRVESFENVTFKDNGGPGSHSNSFILNPAPAGGSVRTYEVPVTQVNRYWGGTAEGYGNTPANMIGTNDVWTVELLWSDHPNLYDAGQIAAKIHLLNNNGEGFGKGKGPDQTFKLHVPAGLPEGNFTLGIKKGTEILWSWHFWVTGYNPDKFNKSLIASGKYTYPVPGGQVERYADNGAGMWEGTGIYKNSVMMDRPLGMVEENKYKQPTNSARGILHYQFGRKDPFSAAPTAAGLQVVTKTDAMITIKESIAKPNQFVYTAGDRWTAEAAGTNYAWCDPQSGSTNDKSIYDPCPVGWKMPVNGVWNDMGRKDGDVFVNALNPLRDLAYNYGRGVGSASYNVNGLRYWPGTAINDPVEGAIFYPAAGLRSSSLSYVGTHGYYWSASPLTSAYHLGFASGGAHPNGANYRSNGFSVRCVSE